MLPNPKTNKGINITIEDSCACDITTELLLLYFKKVKKINLIE